MLAWTLALSPARCSPGALSWRRLGQQVDRSGARRAVAKQPHGRRPAAYWSLPRECGLLA
eukprot:2943704-Alexandrium_andersonii.AAC.1